MNKFLFLDMDGVVNSVEYSVGRQSIKSEFRTDDADPVKLGLIRFICEQTDAQIVITSTWRKGRTVDWFLGYFERAGWPMPPIAGLTPIIHRKGDMVGRGDEVDAWITDNNWKNRSYVILDDDSDFYDWQPLVHCNGVYGITLKETLRCIQALELGRKGDAKLIADLQSHVDFVSPNDI